MRKPAPSWLGLELSRCGFRNQFWPLGSAKKSKLRGESSLLHIYFMSFLFESQAGKNEVSEKPTNGRISVFSAARCIAFYSENR